MSRLHPVDRSFIDKADHHVIVEQTVHAPRELVWLALADHGGWDSWYPGMTQCETNEPGGRGARRVVKLGPLVAHEQWIVWEPEIALGFTVERMNLPMARRMFELIELRDEGGQTLVRFTGAYQSHPLARLTFGRSKRQIQASWSQALTQLDLTLASASDHSTAQPEA